MNTIILHWTPGKNWKELSVLPYLIEDGICDGGMNDIHPWTMSENKDVHEGDVFYIVASKSKRPSSPAYEYLEMMGTPKHPISGIYFCGVIRKVDINEEGKQELDLGIQFGFLPGVIKSVDLNTLKKKVQSVDWEKAGESILNEEEATIFKNLFAKWIDENKYTLENTSFSNIMDRSIETVKEAMSLI